MPTTVEDAFTVFHERLKPTRRESKAARRHRASVRSCLERELNLQSFKQCGSFGNGTSIAGFSDTDYLACLPVSMMKGNSSAVLSRVRGVLTKRFPNTDIRVNSPAIKVPFGTLSCETTEVVPARVCERTKMGEPICLIADGAGGWMRTSPHAHNAYVRARNVTLKGRLKPLICFMKAWKYFNKVPISSFYLEMRVERYMAKKAKVDYERDLAGLFAQLAEGLTPVRDPVGVSGLIRPCTTEAKARQTQAKLKLAASRSAKALAASKRGNVKAAFKWWRMIYGTQFPAFKDS